MPAKPVYAASDMERHRIVESWGSLRWLADATSVGNASGLTLGRVCIRRGESNPRHCHPNCEEALFLLEGTLRHSLGDEEFELRPGDTIVIPAGVFHNAVNTGDCDADMMVAYSEGERSFVLEQPKAVD